ncbi:SAM-dependent methyltransferase [Actinokineospora sp.]|uniref:SAM-dependent methyltransferase n=1 Tax=Actinokineospora sp. TaxID=1872133 RepID=UPI0040383E06
MRQRAPDTWQSWRTATDRALYAESGFHRVGRPAEHFRTSAHSPTAYAAAILVLLHDVDRMLDHPAALDVVDVGGGGGELLAGLARLAGPELSARLRLTTVELAPRPADLPARITWTAALPHAVTGLVVANEWLDNVPVDVVERTADGPRIVLVEPESGAERLGDIPDAADLDWLVRWWPLARVGARAEVGRPRDDAWAGVVRALRRGVAVAADYAHRLPGRPPFGTLTGYRAGRQVSPVPDGSCDITAHVATDACAAAGVLAGAGETLLTTQRAALRALGVRGTRPPIALARTDPPRYLRELRQACDEADLIDRAGLGGFDWLVQAVGVTVPAVLLDHSGGTTG